MPTKACGISLKRRTIMSEERRLTIEDVAGEIQLTIEEIARVGLLVASDAIGDELDLSDEVLLIVGAYLEDKLNQERM